MMGLGRADYRRGDHGLVEQPDQRDLRQRTNRRDESAVAELGRDKERHFRVVRLVRG